MYQKPQLQKFGSFREVTLLGWRGADDQQGFAAVTGCNWGNCPTTS